VRFAISEESSVLRRVDLNFFQGILGKAGARNNAVEVG